MKVDEFRIGQSVTIYDDEYKLWIVGIVKEITNHKVIIDWEDMENTTHFDDEFPLIKQTVKGK